MTDLLSIKWAPVDPTLKSLAKDWVKRLLHVQVKRGVADRKCHTFFKSLNGIFIEGSWLKKNWAIRKTESQELQITLSTKDVNW